MPEARRVVLASGSAARQAMLKAAGVAFSVDPADLDEAGLTDAWLRHSACAPAQDLAELLAEAKAKAVSKRYPQAIVIGADQVLALGETLINKAENQEAGRRTLSALRGRTHELHSVAAIAIDEEIVWRETGTARLTVREFSDAWLDHYVATAADALTKSVGAYAFEGLGIQLFERVEGDYFTILGLPLLPLLAELRRLGALAT